MVIATRVMSGLPPSHQRVGTWAYPGQPRAPAPSIKLPAPAGVPENVGPKQGTAIAPAPKPAPKPAPMPAPKPAQQASRRDEPPREPERPRPAEQARATPSDARNGEHRMVARTRLEHTTSKDRKPNKSLPAGRFGSAGKVSPTHGFGSYALVSVARHYIGTNPTNRARLWCARFMNLVLSRAGYHGTGSDAALSFAHYGRRISGPRIGAIAVMRRKGGGHVGVVSGFDRRGNPILISGNHGHRVAEAVYPRRRILAYVVPR